jgi:hypothetical protein
MASGPRMEVSLRPGKRSLGTMWKPIFIAGRFVRCAPIAYIGGMFFGQFVGEAIITIITVTVHLLKRSAFGSFFQ